MSRPTTVTVSLILWVLASILGIIGAIVAFVALGAAGTVALSGVLLFGAIVALLIALIQIALLVAFARGRNWARIILTILGVLGIIGAIGNGSNGQGTSWFTLIFYVVAIVLAYIGGANSFFRRG